MELNYIPGGICAAKGFYASGIHCGVRNNKQKPDLALIYSETPCSAAGVFTRNKVKAGPVLCDMARLKKYGHAQAILVNSGNANACAPNESENAERMCQGAAAALGIDPSLALCGSTGVIGVELNIEAVENGIAAAKASLSREGSDAAAHAIMTTDTQKKEFACALTLGGKTVTLGGICKGSGMIHPNMGTMLCYLTTDCAISPEALQKALSFAVDRSFNRVSVDGDTSTNDTCLILASGGAGNPEISSEGEDYDAFTAALCDICVKFARSIANDGEGATHLITCSVKGCESEEKAVTMAKSVICSPLTKAAIFGRDANWGRVLAALGYSGESFDPDSVDLSFVSSAGSVKVCEKGRGLDFDEALAKAVLSEREVVILCELCEGDDAADCWGCDLTYDYVKINGDYRT